MSNDDLKLLHNFIHDLKAPMSASKSFIDLLVAAGGLSNDQEHYANRALANLERMNRIITTLLEYARLEIDDEPLDIEDCDVLEIVDEVLDDLDSYARQKQVALNVRISPDAQFVQADDYLLNSVFMNLVSNAIKYNKIGGEVNVTSKEADEFVELIVEDTGLGIPDEAIDRIFDQFYRVETKEHQSVDGTGIGLAMVKGIISKLGGSIHVESRLGEGSAFIFTLPRASTLSSDYDREPIDGVPDDLQEGHEKRTDHDSGELPR